MNEADHLRLAVDAMGVAITATSLDMLLEYRDLIVKWNRVYNLTAVQSPDEMLTRHLLDSLSIASLVAGDSALDVGSGAGLPGIPLAIVCPRMRFTLLDTAAKRTRFMAQVAAELSLSNVDVVNARIEDFSPAMPYGTITSRAFTALPDFVNVAAPRLASAGRLVAMKGQLHPAEMQGIGSEWNMDVRTLDYPGRIGERHAVILSRPAH